jgi:hypothetical protein
MNIVDSIRKVLLGIPTVNDAEATTLLRGVAGRGLDQYGSKIASIGSQLTNLLVT